DRAISRTEWFRAAEEPAVGTGGTPSPETHFARLARFQAVRPDAPRLFEVVRMQEGEMGVPRGAGVDSQAQRMVMRESEVLAAARIDEGEPAGGKSVPGVGGNLVERGPQVRRERAGVRVVNHELHILRLPGDG